MRQIENAISKLLYLSPNGVFDLMHYLHLVQTEYKNVSTYLLLIPICFDQNWINW